MKKPVTVLSLLLALAGVLPRAAVAADAPQPLSAEQSLASFDAAWKLVGESPYDVRGKGLDWDAIGTRYRAQAEAVRDREGLHRVINAMLDEIGESHFGLIPATLVELGDSLQQAQARSEAPIAPGFHDSGIEARIIDDAMRIVRVRADSAAAQAGIRPGWRIETVDGVHLGEALEKLLKLPADHQRLPRQRLEALVRARLGAQSPAAPARLQLRDADDQLLYAVADLVAPDGERLEGRGIQPDISADDSAASLRAGHDRALEAALAWLRAPTSLSPSTAKE